MNLYPISEKLIGDLIEDGVVTSEFEVGDQMGDLVARRIAAVINGEQGGISESVGWTKGGNFVFYNFRK